MDVVFYIAAAIAVAATVLALTRLEPVHALLYLAVSFLAVALVFFLLGAPFVAALEVIVYAGAILVVFVFAIMLLHRGEATLVQERAWLPRGAWIGPALLSAALLVEVVWVLVAPAVPAPWPRPIAPHAVGFALFGPYALGVEAASLLLLSGLIGAFHLARRLPAERPPSPGGGPR